MPVDLAGGELSVDFSAGLNVNNLPTVYPSTTSDSAALDAFARQRFSEPTTEFDSKHIFDSNSLFWDDSQTSGSGTSSNYISNDACVRLGVSNLTAGRRVRQTFRSFNYEPGKSKLIIMTFTFKNLNIEGLGLGDDSNGIFFVNNKGVPTFRIVKSGVPTDIVQDDWNVDKLDGTGNSSYTIDFTKSQIFFFDFEWLGVGRVRFGFFIDGQPIYCHYENHANNVQSVYIRTPNLPLRYWIENDGTGPASTIDHICSTVITEGGEQTTGIVRSIDRGITAFTTQNNTATYPILSMRLKTAYKGAVVFPLNISIMVTSNADHRWALLMNPTIAGVDGVSWTSVPNSAIEFDISRNNTNTLTGGISLASGYATQSLDILNNDINNALILGFSIAGVADQLVLAVQNVGAGAETYYASLTYREKL